MKEFDLCSETATPESYDDVNDEAIHILNVHFVGELSRTRAVKFACARVLHFHKHLPPGASQRVRFDLRGQFIGSRNLEAARKAIIEASASVGIPVLVEFLTN